MTVSIATTRAQSCAETQQRSTEEKETHGGERRNVGQIHLHSLAHQTPNWCDPKCETRIQEQNF